jgi:antitoxin HicB
MKRGAFLILMMMSDAAYICEVYMEIYPVTLERDEDTILVSFLDIPQAHTFGNTEGEALARAVAALETAIAALMSDRKSIPRPSPARGRQTVALPPLSAAKIGLYRAMRAGRVSKAELGRRLKWHAPQVDRLLDLRHASRLDQLDQALRAIGKRLVIGVRGAVRSTSVVRAQRRRKPGPRLGRGARRVAA